MDIVREKKNELELQRIEKIRNGDEAAFEELFFEYFQALCSYALQITQSGDRAKDIVQEVFCKLWKRRANWTIHTSLKAYLFRSVRNEALNQIDYQHHRKYVRQEFSNQRQGWLTEQGESESKVDQKLLNQIWEVVRNMPQRRRSVFVLHRRHGLSYKEIALVLEISRKTVENHMGLALKEIREQIDDSKL